MFNLMFKKTVKVRAESDTEANDFALPDIW